MRSGLLALALAAVALAAPVLAQPLNDRFESMLPLSGGASLTLLDATGATQETGFLSTLEQPTCTNGPTPIADGDNSVWFWFRATTDGSVALDTDGSAYDTILMVIENIGLLVPGGPPSLGGVSALCNDDDPANAPGDRTSYLDVPVEAGRFYYVRVTGYDGAEGQLRLRHQSNTDSVPFQPNDTLPLDGGGISYGNLILSADTPRYGATFNATTQAEDPVPTCVSAANDNGNSTWWVITDGIVPAEGGRITIDLAGSLTPDNQQTDTILSVYAVIGGSTLIEIACNDDRAGGGQTSLISDLQVAGGTVYLIRVSGYENQAGEGRVKMTVSVSPLVAGEPGAAADATRLVAVGPNPTAGAATVRYAVEAPGAVRLSVFDALGREVAVLADGEVAAGEHAVALGTASLAPGLYVVRLAAGGAVRTQTLSVVR